MGACMHILIFIFIPVGAMIMVGTIYIHTVRKHVRSTRWCKAYINTWCRERSRHCKQKQSWAWTIYGHSDSTMNTCGRNNGRDYIHCASNIHYVIISVFVIINSIIIPFAGNEVGTVNNSNRELERLYAYSYSTMNTCGRSDGRVYIHAHST